jgi:hypothetical protein
MTLPTSGQITLNQVNVELGNSGTAQISMNDAAVRGLFGIASGEIEMSDGYGKSNVAWYGERGIIGGGYPKNDISYVTISTTGNASDFGNLSTDLDEPGTCSDGSRIIFAGGMSYNTATYATDLIQYVTASTTGNATTFGDLLAADFAVAGLSNGPRGVFAGGRDRPGYRNFTNVISYITIASTGNATDFGDLLSADTNNFWSSMAGCSNGTRGVFGGAGVYTPSNVMQYITIDTTGNATDFGNLTVSRGSAGGLNGGDRGVFAGGYADISPYAGFNTIDYISIPTTGNATDFGDLTVNRVGPAALSDNSRGIIANNQTIDYITISTTGNASDFGDLNYSASSPGGASGT